MYTFNLNQNFDTNKIFRKSNIKKIFGKKTNLTINFEIINRTKSVFTKSFKNNFITYLSHFPTIKLLKKIETINQYNR